MTSSHSAFTNVITIHGNMAELYRLGMTFKSARLYGFLAANLENHALSRTSGVFCNSAYTESLVAPRAKQTWRVPNAIRAEFFRPSSIASRPNDVPILLNVGHLGMRKRQLEILRLAAELHNEGYRFKLIFTGDTQYTDEYNRAFATELENAVKAGYAAHTGFLDSDKLIQLMDQADGFVHFPSEEAFGLVVAEALARGLKFFGANLGGIKEIGNEVPGAELFDNMNDLKDGISSWLAAGAYRMPGAADRMKKLYSPHAVARRHVEIYASLLGANDSPLLAHSTSEMNLET
jgi:glycosyltransferase involved in cell wall biosynthesis